MTASPKSPPALRKSQARAANPDASVFVSANAGSGKTWVLTQRVINLLLQGVDPAKILCITYTKAAAANMSNRVFDTLPKLTEVLTARCQWLSDHPTVVGGAVGFHWAVAA